VATYHAVVGQERYGIFSSVADKKIFFFVKYSKSDFNLVITTCKLPSFQTEIIVTLSGIMAHFAG